MIPGQHRGRFTWQPGDLEIQGSDHAGTPSCAVDLASAGGHHIAGTADTYRHGWIKVSDGKFGNDPKAKGYKGHRLVVKPSSTRTSSPNWSAYVDGKKVDTRTDEDGAKESAHQSADKGGVPSSSMVRAAQLSPVMPGSVAAIRRQNQIASGSSFARSWDDLAAVLDLSAETGRLASTPAPYGKPGGPGLYGVKGNKHSDYFEAIVKGLMDKRGMDKGQASAIAWGALRKWSRGGGKVHPEVRAAAAGALTGEKAAQARAHAHANTWDEVGGLIDLAAAPRRGWDGVALELAAALPVRVPAGTAAGGQFGAAAGATQQPAAPAGGKAAQKAALLRTAAADKAKAQALIRQIVAAQAQIASLTAKAKASTAKTAKATAATGKTASTSNVTKTTAPAAKTAAAKTATAAKKPSKAQQVTTLQGQVAGWQGQVKTLLAQAAQATAQAAKL